jgi:hypothetical protein
MSPSLGEVVTGGGEDGQGAAYQVGDLGNGGGTVRQPRPGELDARSELEPKISSIMGSVC